jgi:hypothetical protein
MHQVELDQQSWLAAPFVQLQQQMSKKICMKQTIT